MPTSPRIEWLQGMPIFGALRDDTLEFLLGMTRQVAVPSQACFFREGDAASSLFVLQAGRASVLKGWQGREVLLKKKEDDAGGEEHGRAEETLF